MSKVASLQDQIENILSANPFLAQQKLQLEAERGRVVLRGVVRSFYQKQMAQETLRHVDGVEEIENLLEVSWT
ncbi:MAG: transport-associated protein [Planctomycetaceae bacterium]|nr:transport-associated protein [Planctomycetaceae bacterium]